MFQVFKNSDNNAICVQNRKKRKFEKMTIVDDIRA